MPTLKINNHEITVDKGTLIIQAAAKLGYEIPHYCYHPGLSIAGNCRMCLVEVEKMPKLQISCHIQCADGMVVNTETERVKKTRAHILEFLLVNHPLDCPVCDQAGECGLQDYYMKHGLYDSRLNEQKVKKRKAVLIGPHVILDSERCILCSRCVRFTDEVSKTSEFGIFNRGDHSEIGLFPGKELDNKYSGNVVDICPVGALTDRDFRFKCRVWYLRTAPSVCNGCSRGCNVSVEVNTERLQHGHGERVMRMKPRYQPLVNKWWICDEGRYGYKWIDLARLQEPGRRSGKQPNFTGWDVAISEIANRLAEFKKQPDDIAVLLSPQMSNEALYAAKKLFVEALGLKNVLLVSPNKEGFQDDLLIRADKNPNRKGAEILGFSEKPAAVRELIQRATQEKLNALYILGQDLVSLFPEPQTANVIQKLPFVVFQGTNVNLTSEIAHWTLPASAYVETEGTFTNFEGKTQRFSQALLPFNESKPDTEIFTLLAKELGFGWNFFSVEDIGREMREKFPLLQNILEEPTGEEMALWSKQF